MQRAEARIDEREIRRYEAEYVNGLWHWDCHHGSRKVLTARGEWVTPILFGVLDDRSRLACHLQWYLSQFLAETAEVIAHGLSQAFLVAACRVPRSAITAGTHREKMRALRRGGRRILRAHFFPMGTRAPR
jgi:putative transposase